MTRIRQLSLSLVIVLMAVMMPVWVVAPKAAAPLFIITALLLTLQRSWQDYVKAWQQQSRMVRMLAYALILYTLVSCVWSWWPSMAVTRWLHNALYLILALTGAFAVQQLPRETQQRMMRAIVFGLVISVVWMLLNDLFGDQLTQFVLGRETGQFAHLNRALTSMMMVAPLLLLMQPHILPTAMRRGVLVVIILLALTLDSMSAASAVIIGGVAASLVYGVGWARVKYVWVVAVVCAALAFPWVMSQWHDGRIDLSMLPYSTQHRLYIWQFVSGWIVQQPWFGYGMDGIHQLNIQPELIKQSLPTWFPYDQFYPMPGHPHQAFLHVWFEWGFVGVIMSVLLMALIFLRGPRVSGHLAQALWMYSWTATLVIAMMAYGLWQGQWLAAIGFQILIYALSSAPSIKGVRS